MSRTINIKIPDWKKQQLLKEQLLEDLAFIIIDHDHTRDPISFSMARDAAIVILQRIKDE